MLDKRRYRLHWLPLWAGVVTTRWDPRGGHPRLDHRWLVPTRSRAVMRRRPGHKTAQLAAILGLDPPPLPVAWTTPADRARAATLLRPPARSSASARRPTGCRRPGRRSTSRHCFTPCRAAILPGAVPVVFAGPGEAEREMAAPLLAALPDAVDLVGRLEIPEVAACLAGCALSSATIPG
ncbi:MAG: hypothetical protein WDN25_07825 [Acetobacteraceae bacterium]